MMNCRRLSAHRLQRPEMVMYKEFLVGLVCDYATGLQAKSLYRPMLDRPLLHLVALRLAKTWQGAGWSLSLSPTILERICSTVPPAAVVAM